MSLTLYGGARSRATMVAWYLEEKGLPYHWQQLDMAAGEHRQEPFLSLNPFGKVPVLVDDAAVGAAGGRLQLFESGAILLYLADRYGHEFASPEQRALAEQWVLFANATLSSALFVTSNRETEFPRLMGVLDRLLAAGTPLVGEAWGVADCALESHLAYLPVFFPQLDLSPYPHVAARIAATRERPAYLKVMT
ncbi:glutathione S-transferase family protein [Cyanobium sp. ATX 6F1]|uniref:glutathione S-transferase family protein n=1 Tax=Cyanobium sp. ATX 6F1 TaxID=2823702 RepID=UPI0020CEA5F4|nr:glutathione S-transferase family protein [Cyanobium sp. ATX 6F1]MCP9915988.1 glutathione S-transferase family protein [Cyanobium sp. ATX 6F1]